MEQEEIQYQNQQALEEERMNQEAAENAAQQGALSQQAAAAKKNQSEPIIDFLGDIPYFLAIIMAVFKDLIDFIGLGSAPIIGTVITLMILCVLSILVFLGQPSAFLGNFGILFGGSAVEQIPGINLLPAYTAAVVWVYVRTVIKRIKKRRPGASRIAKAVAK